MCGKINLQLIWSSVQCHQCNLASNVDRSSSFKCWDLELQVKTLSNNNNQYDKQLMHWNYVSVSMIHPQVIACFPAEASFDPWCKIGVQCSQFLPGCYEHLEAKNCTSENGVRFTRNHLLYTMRNLIFSSVGILTCLVKVIPLEWPQNPPVQTTWYQSFYKLWACHWLVVQQNNLSPGKWIVWVMIRWSNNYILGTAHRDAWS